MDEIFRSIQPSQSLQITPWRELCESPLLRKPESSAYSHRYLCHWQKLLGSQVLKVKICQHQHMQSKWDLKVLLVLGSGCHPVTSGSVFENGLLNLSQPLLPQLYKGNKQQSYLSSLSCQDNQVKQSVESFKLYKRYLLVLVKGKMENNLRREW